MLGIKIKIYGIVQRVGFRHFLLKNAEDLNITGYVKNDEEGSVSVFAVGEKEQLDKFVQKCKKGPERAKVDLVEVNEAEAINFKDFEIRR